MKINFVTPFFGTSGYVSHAKNLFRALTEMGYDVKISTQLPQGWETNVTDAELVALKKMDVKDRVVIFNGTPNSWYTELVKGPKAFYGYVVWEGSHIPRSWIPILNDKRVTGIFCPSNHTKQAIINTYTDGEITSEELRNRMLAGGKHSSLVKLYDKIKIIPHGVDLSLFYSEQSKNKDPEKLTFICNSGWRGGWADRKGVPYLIKAYLEEFTKDDKVKLIVKVNPAYCAQGWDFNNECAKCGIDKKEGQPEIAVNVMAIEYNKMHELYNMGDVVVSTTKSDAWNLPLLEGMACGLPVITTKYGGMTDFVTKDNGWFIEGGKMEEVEGDWVAYEGISWLTPDIEEIKKVLRYCYEHSEEVKEKGKQALMNSKQWSWRNSAKKIMEVISP